MQDIIKKFKLLDNTKKLVISFITISFVLIIGLTCYNSINKDSNNQDNSLKTIQTEDKQEENKQEETIPETTPEASIPQEEPNDETTSSNINENNQVSQDTPSPSTNNSSSSNNNSTPSPEPTQPAKETIIVNIQVIGMGDTLMVSNITIDKGTNVYNALKELASQNGKTVSGSSSYITGIAGLNEKQHGASSGWIYKVNGTQPNKPAGYYTLNNGDSVVWSYVNYE